MKRPKLDLPTLYRLSGEEPPVPPAVVEQLEIQHKYEGYIKRQEETAQKFAQGEGKPIPPDFDYDGVPGLSGEIRKNCSRCGPGPWDRRHASPGSPPRPLPS